MESLEEALQEFSEMVSANRATQWDLGDKILSARKTFGPKAIGKFAETGRCSTRWCQRLARVSRTFEPENRYLDMDWSIYELMCATESPLEWLERASENEWSAAQLRRAIRGVRPETPKVQKILKAVERVFAEGGDEADALEDGLRVLLRRRE